MLKNIASLYSLSISAGILLWQVLTIDINDRKNCLERFKANNLVGFINFIALYVA
jgi:4-hydroxybenzoate polyprenyltransferase